MGTRADFYIGVGLAAEWLGSVAWDGYEWSEDNDCQLMLATTEQQFRDAVKEISQSRKANDWTSPDMGWPWPWDNSRTTDYAYAFVDGKAQAFNWGTPLQDNASPVDWPNMSSRKNVAFGDRSGVIVVSGKGVVE